MYIYLPFLLRNRLTFLLTHFSLFLFILFYLCSNHAFFSLRLCVILLIFDYIIFGEIFIDTALLFALCLKQIQIQNKYPSYIIDWRPLILFLLFYFFYCISVGAPLSVFHLWFSSKVRLALVVFNYFPRGLFLSFKALDIFYFLNFKLFF